MKHRKQLRLKEYDYNSAGYYFITICIKNRENLFGNIKDKRLKLSDYGKIAESFWLEIPIHFTDSLLDIYVIMPNHIHAIIYIHENKNNVSNDRSKMYIPKIIQNFKAAFTRKIRKSFDDYSFTWQKSYYESVLNSDFELNEIRNYILNNPLNWKDDEFFSL